MQKINSSTKTVIIFVIILLIGGLMYFYTLGSPSDSSTSSLDQQSAVGDLNTQAVGARVLVLLRQISSLKIDKTLFEDPFYQSLQDHTVEIPAQNVGRTNPFSPYYVQYVAPIATTTRRR